MLTVSGLTKRFGGFTALNAVSFEVREGEILGLIGPDGSGKTTAVNCVSGGIPRAARAPPPAPAPATQPLHPGKRRPRGPLRLGAPDRRGAGAAPRARDL